MTSVTPSPVGSRRRSSGRPSPAADSTGPPPPPSGPAVNRSASRHRAPAGTQNAWSASTGGLPYTGPSPQPMYNVNTHLGATPSPRPGYGHSPRPYGASPGPPQAGPGGGGQLVPRPYAPGNNLSHPGPGLSPVPNTTGTFVGSVPTPAPGARKKRLVVACDDSANLSGDAIRPSNVVHLTRAVKPISRDGISQVVFYQSGIGTSGGKINRVVGGATAKGLEDDILQGYYWLCQNWIPGDEIILFGFSRGSFTARSIASMIEVVGLLTRKGIKMVTVIFQDYEHRFNPNYHSNEPDIPFKRKPPASDPRYVDTLEREGLTRRHVPIKAVAVFDTVGSLGIPRIPMLERFGFQSRATREYDFDDTSVGLNIEHAFQALALDEQRASFQPSVWEKTTDNNLTDLRQVWFPGVHTNVGGGYADANLSNITLAWMMAQLMPLLDLDDKYILEQAVDNERYYKIDMGERPRGWSLGRLYNSLVGLWVFGGKQPRKPGFYTRVTRTGVPTDTPLRSTNEFIHASARSRFVLDGTSYRDTGFYRPVGLESYRLRLTGLEAGQGGSVAVWESRRKTRSGPKRVLHEAPLFEIEKQLLGLSPKVEHVVLRPQQAEADMSSGGHGGGADRPDGPPPGAPPVYKTSGGGGGGGGGGGVGNGGHHRRSRHSRQRSSATAGTTAAETRSRRDSYAPPATTFDEERMSSRASL